MRKFRFVLTAALLPGILALLPACEARRDDGFDLVQQAPPQKILGVTIDLSGSYIDKFRTDNGKAAAYCFQSIERAADTMGPDDLIVIGQISNTKQSLLWSGNPRQLAQDFPTTQKFREQLLKAADPYGSRVFDGITDMLTYILSKPGVREGKCKPAVLAFTDMEDNMTDSAAAELRLVNVLKEYRKAGGWIGLYWVGDPYVEKWTGHLLSAGYKSPVVVREIEASVPLPSFN